MDLGGDVSIEQIGAMVDDKRGVKIRFPLPPPPLLTASRLSSSRGIAGGVRGYWRPLIPRRRFASMVCWFCRLFRPTLARIGTSTTTSE